MAESTSDVYDGTQSTPLLTLKELSAIATALEIWRCEVNRYRTNDDLENFSPEKSRTSLKSRCPDLPTVIDTMIKKYVARLGRSIENWLKQHYKRVLFFHYSHQNNILYDFDDFACDYTGVIDYAKTAERMMRCDRFGDIEKFKIACTYFFEDDIARIWSSVWKYVGLNNINFHQCPQLYYWICRLRNELDKIPSSWVSADEFMFDCYMPFNRPSLEYFWKRIPYLQQIRKASQLRIRNAETFVRFILPLFDNHQLDELLCNHGCVLMLDLLKGRYLNETLAFQTWMRMRNVMNEDDFITLIVDILESDVGRDHYVTDDNHEVGISSLLYDEIWYSAPHDLRQSAIKHILSSKSISHWGLQHDSSADLLFSILRCATFKERTSFWHNCWHRLIFNRSFYYVQQIMEMCFENDDAIIEYKENVMATSEYVKNYCKDYLLYKLDFEALNDVADFCTSNQEKCLNFKRRMLEFSFLRKNNVFYKAHFAQAKEFNKYINDVYNNTDLAANFKSHLLSLPVIRCFMPECDISRSCSVQLNEFMELIETFASTEQKLKKMKILIINNWKKSEIIKRRTYRYHYDYKRQCSRYLDDFLFWCLGDEEEVGKFKETYVGHLDHCI